MMFESKGFASIDEFMEQEEAKVLIIANELAGSHDLTGISSLIHFEIPDDTEKFVQRMIRDKVNTEKVASVILATDLELILVKKIEQTICQKIEPNDLPDSLNIISEQKDKKKVKSEKASKNDVPERGEAFHEKRKAIKRIIITVPVPRLK